MFCNELQIYKLRKRDFKCCWDCINCKDNDIIKNDIC